MVTSHRTHHHVKRGVNIFLLVLVCLFAAFLWQTFKPSAGRLQETVNNTEQEKANIHIRHLKLKVELAQTESERARGLSGRSSLGEFDGMLFVFPRPSLPQFWMKNTHFPLDIVWIDEKFKIIGIESQVKPESFPTTYSPPSSVLYVLEVNGGLMENFNIQIGDKLALSD